MSAGDRPGLLVHRAGPLTTVQDLGRPGMGGTGISTSGAADRAAHTLANRLVGNSPGAATLEVTLGGLEVEAERDLVVALTGAVLPGAPMHGTVRLRAGERIVCGSPATGLRTYLAVRGGIATEPVVGSRSTDLLSGLGPPVVQDGDRLPIGDDHAPRVDYGVDTAPSPAPPSGPAHLPVVPGPRADWFAANEWDRLTSTDWTASSRSNRIGLRLEGPGIERHDAGELASEGMVRGAVQVPPSGEPIVFLADHPVTGGYPVIAYVTDEAVDLAAQVQPGQVVRFHG